MLTAAYSKYQAQTIVFMFMDQVYHKNRENFITIANG